MAAKRSVEDGASARRLEYPAPYDAAALVRCDEKDELDLEL